MNIILLNHEEKSFKQIRTNETFIHAGSPYLRVKHTESALQKISGKKSCTIAGAGLAVNLSTGFVTLFDDSTSVEKADFILKETK